MSKKIGDKLADSLRQMRGQPSAATMAPPARAVSAPSAAVSPGAAVTRPRVAAPARTPAPSHGILHPGRIWPD